MATQYPKFSKGEYNHIDKNLAVVDYYLTAKAAQDALITAKRRYDAALDVQAKSTGAMLDKLKATLKELTTPSLESANFSKESALTSAVTRMQGISGSTDLQRRHTKDVVLSLIPLFCTFDEEQLDKAAAKIRAENVSLNSEVHKASGSVGAATSKYNTAIKNWSNVFSDPSFTKGDTDQSKAEFAYNAATRFVDVWRQRARGFLTTVTIEGTSIGTLPPETRDIWAKAYNKLGFSELKRSDLFIPYRHEYSLRPNRREVLNG
jgi:hypothetical protein